jgi:AcrR family transcriptional regulator
MSTPKRTRLPAAARRERIEVAATEVFAQRGYVAASMAEIAARSGVTVPVVYDHFASKLELHRRLLERTRNELLELWREHLFGDEPAAVRIPRAIEAWAAYVEAHPYAARMFFRGVAGDAEADAVHREVQGQARVALGVVLAREPGVERVAGAGDQEALEMVAEIMRSGLAGLAMWWSEHPHVPREQVVRAAVGVLWTGFEQASRPRPPGGGGTAR